MRKSQCCSLFLVLSFLFLFLSLALQACFYVSIHTIASSFPCVCILFIETCVTRWVHHEMYLEPLLLMQHIDDSCWFVFLKSG